MERLFRPIRTFCGAALSIANGATQPRAVAGQTCAAATEMIRSWTALCSGSSNAQPIR